MQGITNSAGSIIGLNSDLTLLWENPNPTSAFSAQTLNIDSSKYRYIVICGKYIASATVTNFNINGESNICIYDKKGGLGQSTQFMWSCSNSNARRFFVITDNAIEVKTGSYASSDNQNNYAIPLAIYGCNNASIEESPSVGTPVQFANCGDPYTKEIKLSNLLKNRYYAILAINTGAPTITPVSGCQEIYTISNGNSDGVGSNIYIIKATDKNAKLTASGLITASYIEIKDYATPTVKLNWLPTSVTAETKTISTTSGKKYLMCVLPGSNNSASSCATITGDKEISSAKTFGFYNQSAIFSIFALYEGDGTDITLKATWRWYYHPTIVLEI